MFRIFALTCALCVYALAAQSQVISLSNPSFEDTPGHSKTPEGWFDCGPPSESPPDVLPARVFGVTKQAYEGATYLGLVTRDNDTWEQVGIQLSSNLEKDNCYAFQIMLAKSQDYSSVSRVTHKLANYTAPIRLRIWGGNDICDQQELLAETSTIDHADWRPYSFTFQPQENAYSHLLFEVFYPQEQRLSTNGNLLLDRASAVVPLENCSELSDDQLSALFTYPRTPFRLSLPKDEKSLLHVPKLLQIYMSDMLGTIQFHPENGTLLDQQFILDKEEDIRQGSPQLYALQLLMVQLPEYQWELFIEEDIEVLRELKMTDLEFALAPDFEVSLTINPLDETLVYTEDWFAKSEIAGLYLRRYKIE